MKLLYNCNLKFNSFFTQIIKNNLTKWWALCFDLKYYIKYIYFLNKFNKIKRDKPTNFYAFFLQSKKEAVTNNDINFVNYNLFIKKIKILKFPKKNTTFFRFIIFFLKIVQNFKEYEAYKEFVEKAGRVFLINKAAKRKFVFIEKLVKGYYDTKKLKNNIPFRFITNFLFLFQKIFYTRINSLLFKYMHYLIYISKNYLSIYLKKDALLFSLYYLKFSSFFLFKLLTDIVIVDNANFMLTKRFKIIYNLYSIKFNYRLLVNVFISTNENVISVYSLYANSNWLEREAWDMFGVFFINHPDLRRILTDYGFKGYPLRKDFPVSGYVEAWYDDILQDIIYKPVKLAQEMRFFTFSTVWENLM